MTKEEIFSENIEAQEDQILLTDSHRDAIEKSMDQYAKQQAMEFGRWVVGHIDEIYIAASNGLWQVLKPTPKRTPTEYITDDQLYEKFLQSKQQK